MPPSQPVRAAIDGKPAAALTAEQERCISPYRQQMAATGMTMSADEATAAYIGQTKRLFIVTNCSCLAAASAVALLSEPNQALAFSIGLVANLALAAVLFVIFQRRVAIWRSKLGLRMIGLMPAGSSVGFDEGGLRLADRVIPWASLSIDQVDLSAFTHRDKAVYTIDRLLITGPTGRVVLDPAMMRNGRVITDNVWRRLRATPTTSGWSILWR
jgi:hypothetical protein